MGADGGRNVPRGSDHCLLRRRLSRAPKTSSQRKELGTRGRSTNRRLRVQEFRVTHNGASVFSLPLSAPVRLAFIPPLASSFLLRPFFLVLYELLTALCRGERDHERCHDGNAAKHRRRGVRWRFRPLPSRQYGTSVREAEEVRHRR